MKAHAGHRFRTFCALWHNTTFMLAYGSAHTRQEADVVFFLTLDLDLTMLALYSDTMGIKPTDGAKGRVVECKYCPFVMHAWSTGNN